MPKPRKTWREKLLDDKDLPKVSVIEGKMSKRWGEGTCAIPVPREVGEIMKAVLKGRLITTKEIQAAIAMKHHVTMACPMCFGIFAWIAAHAGHEAETEGAKRIHSVLVNAENRRPIESEVSWWCRNVEGAARSRRASSRGQGREVDRCGL